MLFKQQVSQAHKDRRVDLIDTALLHSAIASLQALVCKTIQIYVEDKNRLNYPNIEEKYEN